MTRVVCDIGQPRRMETCGAEEPYEGNLHVRFCGGIGRVIADPTRTPDCLQPPLLRRSRFRQQVSAGVDMTSDVKGWEQLFYVYLMFFPLVSSIGRAGASKTRRLITLISVGWLPPSWHPSGACLIRGTSVPCGLFTLRG